MILSIESCWKPEAFLKTRKEKQKEQKKEEEKEKTLFYKKKLSLSSWVGSGFSQIRLLMTHLLLSYSLSPALVQNDSPEKLLRKKILPLALFLRHQPRTEIQAWYALLLTC